MPGDNIGADTFELDNLHRELRQQAENIRTLRDHSTSLLESTTWQGHASSQFRNVWHDEFHPSLSKMADAHDNAADEVRYRKEALMEADRVR